MLSLTRSRFPGRSHPDRIIPFGDGNFWRAFLEWQIDLLTADVAEHLQRIVEGIRAALAWTE